MLVVEEHLGNQEFCPRVYFAFEVSKIRLHVGRIGVFFWVAGCASAKAGFTGIGDFFVQVNTRIHVLNLVNEVECVLLPFFSGSKLVSPFGCHPATQGCCQSPKAQFN